MAEGPQAWGTMPIPELIELLEAQTAVLCTELESLGVDEGARQRKFWAHWGTLGVDVSIAAANRECEYVCKELDEIVALHKARVESHSARQRALIAALAARTA